MDEVEKRNLFQEINSFEESSQGFCNLINNLSFHPSLVTGHIDECSEGDSMEIVEEGEELVRDSVIVRNQRLREEVEDDVPRDGRPVLTYLGTLDLMIHH